MSAPNTNQLSYNAYVTHIGVMAVVQTQNVGGVVQGVDPAFTEIIPNMLNYAELRIQRDLDILASQASNTYTLTPGTPIFSLPVNDFFTVQTVAIVTNGDQPLLPVSKEFIQNCYSGQSNADVPQYFAVTGDNFGDGADSYMNVYLGPPPNYPYTLRVTGMIRTPSLYTYASPWRGRHAIHLDIVLSSRHANHGQHDLHIHVPAQFWRDEFRFGIRHDVREAISSVATWGGRGREHA
jgi:hypothetical protein